MSGDQGRNGRFDNNGVRVHFCSAGQQKKYSDPISPSLWIGHGISLLPGNINSMSRFEDTREKENQDPSQLSKLSP
jgi:hypothetical protein